MFGSHISKLCATKSALRLSVVKPRLIDTDQRKENVTRSQWDLKFKTSKLSKARENASDYVSIGLSFESDWLKKSGASYLDQSRGEEK